MRHKIIVQYLDSNSRETILVIPEGSVFVGITAISLDLGIQLQFLADIDEHDMARKFMRVGQNVDLPVGVVDWIPLGSVLISGYTAVVFEVPGPHIIPEELRHGNRSIIDRLNPGKADRNRFR